MQNNKSLYEFDHPVSDEQILEAAAYIIAQKQFRHGALRCPKDSEEYLRHKLALIEHEVFAVLFLDSQNRILEYKELFRGTINAASVYPREVVKEVLALNAASVILAHNHPSGVSTPSQADKLITTKLQQALNLIDVSIVDHIIIGETSYSFAEHGLI
ncbi:DNA repair protein RadC [Pseudoalteromonas sp. APC 3358]|uniref:RadC family protein n=1 Tax=Pseudoalteromonas sp. APC 3358 TaxID=3035176 RepID=UPI0025B3FCFB|nr:DNA repair protein RadC [Pseudoalteromonas sp. APC 3358]MDN3384341.1 DNA repair protein RadC [Pseudoalteromonas sp. APC 3358]